MWEKHTLKNHKIYCRIAIISFLSHHLYSFILYTAKKWFYRSPPEKLQQDNSNEERNLELKCSE